MPHESEHEVEVRRRYNEGGIERYQLYRETDHFKESLANSAAQMMEFRKCIGCVPKAVWRR